MNLRIVLSVSTVLFAIGAAAYFLTGEASLRTVSGQQAATSTEPDGGGPMPDPPSDLIRPEQRDEIQKQIRENIAMLEREGRLAEASPEVVALSWPVRKAP